MHKMSKTLKIYAKKVLRRKYSINELFAMTYGETLKVMFSVSPESSPFDPTFKDYYYGNYVYFGNTVKIPIE